MLHYIVIVAPYCIRFVLIFLYLSYSKFLHFQNVLLAKENKNSI